MNKRQYKKWLSKRCKHSYADARCQMIKDYIKETYDDEYNMYYILDSRRGGYKHILKIVGFKNACLNNINTVEVVYDENQQANTRDDESENVIKR